MKRTFISALCLVGCLVAQTQNRHILGSNPYLYDGFQQGQAFFIEGDPVEARFNYNILLQEMQFIDPRDSTQLWSLAIQPNMTYIQIGNDAFVRLDREGWALVVQDEGPIALLQTMRLVPKDKKGAYGVPLTTSGAQIVSLSAVGSFTGAMASVDAGKISDHAAITNPDPIVDRSNISESGAFAGLNMLQNFKLETYYWIVRNWEAYYPATRRNFLNRNPEIASQTRRFISEHNVNFYNPEDLKRLVRHSNNLLKSNR